MTDLVLRASRDGVLTLTLNRPGVLNAFTDPLLDAITDGVRAGADDADVRAIVITGAGRGFCAGQDLSLMGAGASDEGGIDIAGHLRDHYVPMIEAIRSVEKPVIAAVNGVAAGAGLSLALACDLRIASESATFIQAFVRIGLVPDAGGSYFLPRLIGLARATEMAMLGETVDAPAALEWGLVNRVFPADVFTAEAQTFAARLARAPRSVGIIKRLLSTALDNDLAAQMRREEELQVEASQTDDFIEGVSAFAAKRHPAFTGK